MSWFNVHTVVSNFNKHWKKKKILKALLSVYWIANLKSKSKQYLTAASSLKAIIFSVHSHWFSYGYNEEWEAVVFKCKAKWKKKRRKDKKKHSFIVPAKIDADVA